MHNQEAKATANKQIKARSAANLLCSQKVIRNVGHEAGLFAQGSKRTDIDERQSVSTTSEHEESDRTSQAHQQTNCNRKVRQPQRRTQARRRKDRSVVVSPAQMPERGSHTAASVAPQSTDRQSETKKGHTRKACGCETEEVGKSDQHRRRTKPTEPRKQSLQKLSSNSARHGRSLPL